VQLGNTTPTSTHQQIHAVIVKKQNTQLRINHNVLGVQQTPTLAPGAIPLLHVHAVLVGQERSMPVSAVWLVNSKSISDLIPARIAVMDGFLTWSIHTQTTARSVQKTLIQQKIEHIVCRVHT